MTFVLGLWLLLAFLFLVYALFLLRVLSGLYVAAPGARPQNSELVSVIIAVRNEEPTIAACLESILSQEYPKESYEIIISDDGSSDETRTIVNRFRQSYAQIRLIVDSDNAPVGNKRAALMAGIREAKGDILLFTDGDCIVKPGWIAGMAGALRDPTRFVAGPVVEAGEPGLLKRLSRLEFLGLIGVAGGLMRAGNPIFCNGANIAYRKTAFEEIGGFGPDVHFSDDEAILQRFHTRRPGSAAFTFEPESI